MRCTLDLCLLCCSTGQEMSDGYFHKIVDQTMEDLAERVEVGALLGAAGCSSTPIRWLPIK